MRESSECKCPLCGNGECHTRLTDGPITVMKCTACDIGWRLGGSPAAPAALSESFFSAQLTHAAPGWDSPPLETHCLKSGSFPHLALLEIELAGELRRPPGTLLNIGRDEFDFLENAKICGWNTTAVTDFSALPQHPPLNPLELGDLAEEFEEGGYDVVRLEGILKYADDPVAMLGQVSRIQNPSGLIIISDEDAGAFDFPLYGEGSSLIPRELPRWFFTAKSLGLIMRRAGLSIARLKTSKEPPHISLFARRSMRHQYRGMRRWIDPHAPQIQPQEQRLVPA